MTSDPIAYKFKIALIGDYGSGKSCLYRRMVEDKYSDNDHHEFDFDELTVYIDGKKAKVALFDTAGTEQHSSVEGSYFRGLVGFFLVYDVGTWKSFERIDYWRDQIDHYAADGVQIVLVANKCDLPVKSRAVEEFDGKKEAARLGVPFFEVSAKTGANIKAAFQCLVKAVADSDIPGVKYEGPQEEAKSAGSSSIKGGKGGKNSPAGGSSGGTIQLHHDSSSVRDTRPESSCCVKS